MSITRTYMVNGEPQEKVGSYSNPSTVYHTHLQTITISDPNVIDAYMNIRSTRDSSFIKHYAKIDVGGGTATPSSSTATLGSTPVKHRKVMQGRPPMPSTSGTSNEDTVGVR